MWTHPSRIFMPLEKKKDAITVRKYLHLLRRQDDPFEFRKLFSYTSFNKKKRSPRFNPPTHT